MSNTGTSGNVTTFWNKVAGNVEDFSMKNRAFNYVCVASFALLVVFIIFDIYLQLYTMTAALFIMLILLAGVYYLARFKKNYKVGVMLYAFISYAALSLNFFLNSGSLGPTIYLFFVTFIFFIVLGRPKHRIIWIATHIALPLLLLSIEYFYPELLPDTYISREARYIDLVATYMITLAFIFTINNYLRNYYNAEANLARERALAIEKQNDQIKIQNQQLERVNGEKDKLFSIISHDLKSPLDSIRGFLEMLSDNLLDDSEKESIQEELLEQTKYTTDLLHNLMSWAKTQMHGAIVVPSVQNLGKFVEYVAENKKSVAARKGIKLTYSINPTIEVVCDRDMLHIVLRNLINNAIKFTKSGGEVSIKVVKTTDKVYLSVQDTGIGISKEKQQDLFTMKTSSTYGTNQEKGIGLGLMMCKEYMEYMKGEIWFESEQGKGSTFFVSLPLTKL